MQNEQNNSTPVQFAADPSLNSSPIKITTMHAVPADKNAIAVSATEGFYVFCATKKSSPGSSTLGR